MNKQKMKGEMSWEGDGDGLTDSLSELSLAVVSHVGCRLCVYSLIHLRHVHVINKAGNFLAHRRPVRILGALLHGRLQSALHIQRGGSR